MEGPYLVDQRQWPTAVLCGTQVYSFGGKDSEGEDTCSVSIFNLETNTHRIGPPMPSVRVEFAVILLDDHRILISEGRLGQEGLDTTEIFDVVSETFFEGPELEMAR